jgi:hypothetical protein
MKQTTTKPGSSSASRLRCARTLGSISACIAMPVLMQGAHAADFSPEDSDVKIRWDNTLRYSAGFRLKDPSPKLITPPVTLNQDDGDRSFDKGLISNRVDLFTEADISYKGFGARISGAAWYDQIYNQSNDNNSPSTFNPYSVPFNQFTSTARNLQGNMGEILDAFAFGKVNLGQMPLTFRLGRHSIVWGESLFFGNNGIAGTQQSTDVIKLLSVPNSQFKEIVRPENQFSSLLQVTPNVTLGAYYKLEWENNRLPPGGSYFASTDIINGGERLFTSGAPFPGGAPRALFRGPDMEASSSGQGGVEAKWRPSDTDLDLGVYAVRFNDRNPSLYQYPGVGTNPRTGQVGLYNLVYAENIEAYGLSASTSVGAVNFAGEASIRRNAALPSDPQVVAPNVLADNDKHPLYAVGNTAHVQFSTLWAMKPNFVSREASLAAEVAWNRRLSITKNPAALATFAERDAWGMRLIYTPTYRQVMPGLDLSVPVGFSYFPKGKSSAISNFGVDKGGDFTIGLNATYLDVWRFSLAYTQYYGPEGPYLRLGPTGRPTNSFEQSLKDRNFASISVTRTF